jgi:hypothetical protein
MGAAALLLLLVWTTAGCITERVPHESRFGAPGPTIVKITALARTMQIWNADYPVAELDRLPAAVRDAPVGYIADPETFASVWKAFEPELVPPPVNFDTELILFARNVDFYNSLSIVQVGVNEGVAEPVVRETRSTTPVTDLVAMSMVLVVRSGIIAVKANGEVVPLPDVGPAL